MSDLTVPPGVPVSMRTLAPLTAGLLKCEVGYGGALHGFRTLAGSGQWSLLSTPADVRPQSMSEDGLGQVCVAAAATATEPQSIVQQAQATALLYGSTWLPQNSRPQQMDSLGAIGGPGWGSWWECFDSELGDKIPSPLWMQQTLGVRSEPGRTWVRADVTSYRMSGRPNHRYERWNLPYIVLDGTKITAVEVDGVRTPTAQIPSGAVTQPRRLLSPIQTPLIRIVTASDVGGRALLIRAEAWDGVIMWRPHAQVLIITGILNNRPCLPGQPVSLWWEIEAA